MCKKYSAISFFIFVLFFFTHAQSFAQMSDMEVVKELQMYQSQGLTQQQILARLSEKGVTAQQLQRIREAHADTNPNTGSIGVESNNDPNSGATRAINDNIIVQGTNTPQKEKVFGQNFFTTSNLSFSPNANMPTPANYVLGPGDEVIIDLWGDSELNLKYTIAPDGYIAVPGLGRIQLSGLRVEQATAKIRNQFSTIYSDLDSSSPRTFLGVSVGNTRSIKVNVMGEVRIPGTYTMTSFSSVFHALYAAGGINDIGSLRNIRVFRSGRVAATVDIYEYLMKGNNMGDITLRDGDIIKVDPYGILVQVEGNVKRAMKYEMKENETVKDLLAYAGGFQSDAFKTNLLLSRMGENEKEAYTIDESQYSSFRLKDGDVLNVGDVIDRFSNRVEISGAVERPGKYAISKSLKTIKDLINIAQGTKGDAFVRRALLYRQKEDLTYTLQSLDLSQLMQNRIPDITLQRNDRLYIPSERALNETFHVYIQGAVREPGEYSYAENMSIEDIILQAGGLKESASLARVDVYRRLKNPMSTEVSRDNAQAFSFTLENGLVVTSDTKNFTLQPFDQVVVRESPGYEPQQMVTVSGEVLFGGQYAKLHKGERLSSLISRAGGLSPQAYKKGARLTRRMNESERLRALDALKADLKISEDSIPLTENLNLTHQFVGIDLEKAIKRPGSDDDLVLREGDVLSIPYYTGTVKISGGVNYPITVTYKKGMNIDGYIRQAGGYSRLAMKSKPFIIYMNGKGASGRWAKVEPGCEIIVPEKPDREPMSTQAILGITTSVASLALIVANLLK